MATYDEIMKRIISKQAQPSVALQYNDPRRVDPSHPYPATRWDGSESIVGGSYPNPERASHPLPYVPGSDDRRGKDGNEAAMQYRGQVEGLTPESRQIILDTANSEQQIENLIQIYGLPGVERVLREDIASCKFHSVGDVRDFMGEDATQQTLYNRSHGIIGNTDWMR